MNPTTYKHTRIAALTISIASALALTAPAADVLFKDTTGDHDLSNPANWSPSSWTAADTLLVSKNNATIPATGLHLSGDMPASAALKFGEFPNENVKVDFGGHSLNTTNLVFSNMHDDSNRFKYLLASGGFSGVKNLLLNEDNRGHVRFTNGVFQVQNSLMMGNRWFPFVHVLAEAELVVEKIVGDTGVGMSAYRGEFIVDGGRFVVKGHAATAYYKRAEWTSALSANKSLVIVRNGGEYSDESATPANFFRSVDFTIKDAAYCETNSTTVQGNTLFSGSTEAKIEITNSVFRVAQFYCGRYEESGYSVLNDFNLSGRTVDFCDSEETFAFAPGSTRTTAGMIVPPAAANNTIKFRGSKNRFTSQTFVLGGSNTVEVTGGKFAVSNVFEFVGAAKGKGSRLILRDADIYLAQVTSSATATNTLIEVSGSAMVKGGGDFTTGGPGSSMRVTDNAVVDIGTGSFRLAGNGSELCLFGAASTGCVVFAASDCRAVIADTTHGTKLGPSWTHYAPFTFAAGQANNVLVISNATFRCGSYAFKNDISTGSGDHEVQPFTGCPGCAIELRGSRAKLIFPTGSAHANGAAYFTMAFGEMIDQGTNQFTTEPYALDNPLRLRFVLPPSTDPYLEPPVQSSGQTLCLGGNAEFEFDMSEYDWPTGTVTFPLISCAKGFKATKPSGTHTYINVAQLNETNASRMPVDKYGHTAGKLVLSADGKTLCLTVKNAGPTVVVFR